MRENKSKIKYCYQIKNKNQMKYKDGKSIPNNSIIKMNKSNES
jgi:hypothetical protein